MDVFELATKLTTTGEDQVAAALKRVEEAGTGSAKAVTSAWGAVNFGPATQSAQALGAANTTMAGQMRSATGAAMTEVSAVGKLGAAQSDLARRMRAAMAAASQRVPPVVTPATVDAADKYAGVLKKLQGALFQTGIAAAGVPGKFGKVAQALLQLGAGGLVVGAIGVGMALIGSAIAKAREKAEAESQRINDVVQRWQDRLDEMTGAARRKEIDALATDVERLADALAKAQSTLATQQASPLVGAQSETVAEVDRLKRELDAANRRLGARRDTVDTGPGSTAALDTRLKAIAVLTAADATRAEGLRQLGVEEAKLTVQLAAGNLPAATRARLTEQLTAVQNAQRDAIDKNRAAYDKYLQTLAAGAGIEGTREEAQRRLAVEEGKLQAQLDAGTLAFADRVRVEQELLQVQTARGTLPETEEQRAQMIADVRDAYEGYLNVLMQAVEFEATRPQALDEIGAAIGRVQTRLRSQNLDLTEEVRLRRQLADLKAAQAQGVQADRTASLTRTVNVQLRLLNTGLDADLALIEANTNAMLEGLGLRLSKTAQEALQTVNEALVDGMRDAVGGLFEGLAQGIFDKNAKAGDLILASLGSIFTRMGQVMIASGLALAKFMAALTSLNPVAAIAAGVLLLGIGTALSSAASGRSGGGAGPSGPSFDNYRPSDDRVVRIIVNQPAGQQGVSQMTPVQPVNITVIGPADPVAQRGIAQMFNAAQDRGLIKKPRG
jgi:hypothetical protein